MAKVDRESLQAWYRTALRRRVGELEALRPGLARREPAAQAAARAVGQALVGSGGTFGFAEVSEAGSLLEDGAPEGVARLTEGVVALLRRIAWPDDPAQQRGFAWLTGALGLPPRPAATLEDAWRGAAEESGLSAHEVARRVAACYGTEGPEPLHSTAGALRLVPEAMMRERAVLPLDEDGRVIRVATSNPADLSAEAEIHRVSGRTPRFVVVPPTELAAGAQAAWREARRAGPPGAASRGETPTAPPAAVPASAPCPILVVDDDPGARVLARAVLERKGYRVVEAADGEEALARWGSDPGIRLAVVDLEMPGMGGAELVRGLRASPGGERLAIVVLTGAEDPALEVDLIEGGADDYLQKPLEPRLFLARVAATLRRSGAGVP